MDLLARRTWVHPPFRAPDAPDPPSQIGQYHLAQPVAIPGGGGTMVCGAVALDSGKIPPRKIRMDDSEIDPKEGNPHLRMNFPTPLLQRAHDRVLERRLRLSAGRRECLRDGTRTVFRELEEVLEVDDALRSGSAEINLLGTKRRKNQKFSPRPSNGDVEAP